MRDLKPLPATASKARISETQKSARVTVILAFIASVTFWTFLKKTLAVLITGWWVLGHVCLPARMVEVPVLALNTNVFVQVFQAAMPIFLFVARW